MQANRELEQYLSQLPGVGPRQAKRIIQALLRREPFFSRRLGELIQSVRQNMRVCEETFQYFYSEDQNETLSEIAKDPSRDHGKILVVESDSDLEAIEKTDLWRGTYFVLGGNLKPATNESSYDNFIRLNQLNNLVTNKYQNHTLSEVILGLSSSINGDFTADIVRETVAEISDSISISQLGRGLSTGTALEYIDKNTFESALEHRTTNTQ